MATESQDLASKIVLALERLGQLQRQSLWQIAVEKELSPIQAQILMFIGSHDRSLATVTYLAREFAVTKATISDAVATLVRKGLLVKTPNAEDRRIEVLSLTAAGKRTFNAISDYQQPTVDTVQELTEAQRSQLWSSLSTLIHHLQTQDLTVAQRMCYTCTFFRPGSRRPYCRLLEMALSPSDIRLDCPEHEPADA